jgi:hypothetical protein
VQATFAALQNEYDSAVEDSSDMWFDEGLERVDPRSPNWE